MVVSSKEWGSIAVAMEKMLESFDTFLQEVVKSILLFMMELLEVFLVLKSSDPDFFNKVVETISLPYNFLVVRIHC